MSNINLINDSEIVVDKDSCDICGQQVNALDRVELLLFNKSKNNNILNVSEYYNIGVLLNDGKILIAHAKNYDRKFVIIHDKCINFSQEQRDTDKLINLRGHLPNHFDKYLTNIQRKYCSLIILLLLLTIIFSVIAYNCYNILDAENNFNTSEYNYQPNVCLYDAHTALIINSLLLLIINMIIIFRIILLIFK